MDSLLFILVLVCLVIVAGWYVGNELRGRKGDWGLLAIISDLRERLTPDASRYRTKHRRAEDVRPTEEDEVEPSYRAPEERRRFHEKDDPAYRSRGPLPKFGERAGGKPDDRK